VDDAETYWKDVGCSLFGKRNVFWYTLRDANPANKVKFAITDNLSTKPRFDLSCPVKKDLPTAEPITNGNITSGASNSSSSNSSSSSNGGNGISTGSPSAGSPTNGAAQSSGPSLPESTGAGSVTSISMVNSMAMVLSVIFAVATWAL